MSNEVKVDKWEKTSFLKEMVENNVTNEFVEIVEEFGKYIATKAEKGKEAVTTNQIRKVYSYIKKLELSNDIKKIIPRLRLLPAYLKYSVGKNDKIRKLKDLQEVLEEGLKEVTKDNLNEDEQKARFERFCLGFESILAYHRYYGGK